MPIKPLKAYKHLGCAKLVENKCCLKMLLEKVKLHLIILQ